MALGISWSASSGVLLALALAAAAPVRAQSLVGSYAGRYECQQRWVAFSVNVLEIRNGKIGAEGAFPSQFVRTNGFQLGNPARRIRERGVPIEMEGSVTADGAITLRTGEKIILSTQQREREVTFRGARDESGSSFALVLVLLTFMGRRRRRAPSLTSAAEGLGSRRRAAR